jgi:hypothetical protein
MNNGPVPDRNIIAYDCLGPFKRAMQDRSILDVYFVSDPDAVNIAPDDGIEPDAAVAAHYDVTYDCCVGCNVAVFTPGRVNIPHR